MAEVEHEVPPVKRVRTEEEKRKARERQRRYRERKKAKLAIDPAKIQQNDLVTCLPREALVELEEQPEFPMPPCGMVLSAHSDQARGKIYKVTKVDAETGLLKLKEAVPDGEVTLCQGGFYAKSFQKLPVYYRKMGTYRRLLPVTEMQKIPRGTKLVIMRVDPESGLSRHGKPGTDDNEDPWEAGDIAEVARDWRRDQNDIRIFDSLNPAEDEGGSGRFAAQFAVAADADGNLYDPETGTRTYKADEEKPFVAPPAGTADGRATVKEVRKMLRTQGACGPPLRYLDAFPEQTKFGVIWREYFGNWKAAPNDDEPQGYWLGVIMGYVPGLMEKVVQRAGVQGQTRSHKVIQEIVKLNPWGTIEEEYITRGLLEVAEEPKEEEKAVEAPPAEEAEVNPQQAKEAEVPNTIEQQTKPRADENATLDAMWLWVHTVAEKHDKPFRYVKRIFDYEAALNDMERWVKENANEVGMRFQYDEDAPRAGRIQTLERLFAKYSAQVGVFYPEQPEQAEPIEEEQEEEQEEPTEDDLAQRWAHLNQRVEHIEAFLVKAAGKAGLEFKPFDHGVGR